MSKVLIEEDLLRRWQKRLEESETDSQLAKKACFDVGESIFHFLNNIELHKKKMEQENKGLAMKDIVIGEEYRIRDISTVKPGLRGATLKVIQKKRTKVIAELTETTRIAAKGTAFNINTDLLEYKI